MKTKIIKKWKISENADKCEIAYCFFNLANDLINPIKIYGNNIKMLKTGTEIQLSIDKYECIREDIKKLDEPIIKLLEEYYVLMNRESIIDDSLATLGIEMCEALFIARERLAWTIEIQFKLLEDFLFNTWFIFDTMTITKIYEYSFGRAFVFPGFEYDKQKEAYINNEQRNKMKRISNDEKQKILNEIIESYILQISVALKWNQYLTLNKHINSREENKINLLIVKWFSMNNILTLSLLLNDQTKNNIEILDALYFNRSEFKFIDKFHNYLTKLIDKTTNGTETDNIVMYKKMVTHFCEPSKTYS